MLNENWGEPYFAEELGCPEKTISEKSLIEHGLMNKHGKLRVSIKEANSLLKEQSLPLLYEELED
jgi:hypothetical protein